MLSPDDKFILVLRDMETRPLEDVAAITGTRPTKAAARLAVARERLRNFHYRWMGGKL